MEILLIENATAYLSDFCKKKSFIVFNSILYIYIYILREVPQRPRPPEVLGSGLLAAFGDPRSSAEGLPAHHGAQGAETDRLGIRTGG